MTNTLLPLTLKYIDRNLIILIGYLTAHTI